MDARENYIRAIEFRYPEWIPCESSYISIAYWLKYGEQRMDELILRHPLVFPEGLAIKPNLEDPPEDNRTWRDDWGVVWWEPRAGEGAQSIGHPLAHWEALKEYRPPDPLTTLDWAAQERRLGERRQRGLLTRGHVGDLFTFVIALRGFENLMLDIATDDPHLPLLYEMLSDWQMRRMDKYLELGIDLIDHHNDLGNEQRLTISPAKFRQHIKPYLRRLYQRARGAGAHVFMSSDGYHLDIVDDLIEIGVSIHDPQLHVNPIEGLKRLYKGRLAMCIRLDAQRMPFYSPAEVTAIVKEIVDKLGDRRGGLVLDLGCTCTADTPLENIEAACTAFEQLGGL